MKTASAHAATYAALIFTVFTAHVVHAQSGATPSSVPAAGDSVKSGDLIIWKVNKIITLSQTSTPAGAGPDSQQSVSGAEASATAADADTVCFPNQSRFDVTSVIAASKSTTSTQAGVITPANTEQVSGHFSSSRVSSIFHWRHFHAIPKKKKQAGSEAPGTSSGQTPCGGGAQAVYDHTYTFSGDQLSQQDFDRAGFTWGGLVVPYKF